MIRSRFGRAFDLAKGRNPLTVLRFILHLPNFVRLSFRLLGDPRVPLHLKLFCYGAIAYVILPFDLLPDLAMFGVGYVEDLVLVYLAFNKLMTDSPREVVQQHVQAISEYR